MAEKQDEKSKLPLTGILALLAMVSSLLIYQEISLQTSRPIDKAAARAVFSEKGVVQSRLWQDPFEAVGAYRLTETKPSKKSGEDSDSNQQLHNLVLTIAKSGVSSLRVLPVFVDGSPYSSGAETRLNDRYALVSALGAAGYAPESGEFIRFFTWKRPYEKKTKQRRKAAAKDSGVIIPAELFIPKAKLRDSKGEKYVLVLWLKDQDFSSTPLEHLSAFRAHLDKAFKPKITPTYSVLGPRFSTGLSAMVKEIKKTLREKERSPSWQGQSSDPPFAALKDVHFYSPWATTEDTFLLDYSPDPNIDKAQKKSIDEVCNSRRMTSGSSNSAIPKGPIEKLFICAGIENFSRTIGTDAVLAEQLYLELKRRRVYLKPCAGKDCASNPKVALISEWDTLYGRSLPRTFAAVVQNSGSGQAGPELEAKINRLRKDDWPDWISRHSYLAGLDGELPAKGNDEEKDEAQPEAKAWYEGQNPTAGQKDRHRPEGRSQLDYVVRLAAGMKQEEAKNGEFRAIGVLGGDVYDKLVILQALRNMFPSAIFFTTDLNARLAYPAQWNSTRNLIIASHFGLELQSELQTPIPPFRDSYQTSLFYSALLALAHLSPVPSCDRDYEDTVQLTTEVSQKSKPTTFWNTGPRLYEIGRHGPFDISTGPYLKPPNYSIHPARPDMEALDSAPNWNWLVEAATVVILVLGVCLISTNVWDVFRKLISSKLFSLGLVAAAAAGYSLLEWARRNASLVAESEPFVLSEGISAWPTAAIRLLALITSLLFLWHCWRKMRYNEVVLAHNFNLDKNNNKLEDKPREEPYHIRLLSGVFTHCFGFHQWKPHASGPINAVQLWQEYIALGNLKNSAMRGFLQVTVALTFAWLIMALFGFPNTPCRGTTCFVINNTILILSVTAMMILIFYVIDATRLCRRWVNCVAMKKVRWPDSTLVKIASERGMSRENLDEWLGIELIAQRTTVIGYFIYFPFIVMILLGVARHSYLDNWGFPLALLLIFTVNAGLIIVNALALRKSAERARHDAVRRLESKLIPQSGHTPEEIKQKQQIEWAISAIKNNQKGAFLPFTQHPIFGAAIALPSGGYGLVLLLEYLATGF
ncbi:hypothetical protein [Nitrosospira briensis]|uniref:hypothetical protein n=1 Tax=Nitrosospira briensis TaxID=35799 RepID=UPI0008EB158E|nr:hypothetical protein [Nitrosospira briensis]SFN76672.1 hypothetical protein SAMN05216332_101539 [Nitrosospira briensis]